MSMTRSLCAFWCQEVSQIYVGYTRDIIVHSNKLISLVYSIEFLCLLT